jgi:DNA-binding transcriptional regulator GbsR (MarR family)
MKTLSAVERKFVLHWGEMGTRWGINRTVAQIHALLFLAPRPLNADDLVETLGVARSNVSTSLKELQGWGIVRLVHILDDKRDHFESMQDPWEMFRVVLDERKRREIDPTAKLLRECAAESGKEGAGGELTEARLNALLEFFETTTAWYEQLHRMPTASLRKFMKLGDKALKLLKLAG